MKNISRRVFIKGMAVAAAATAASTVLAGCNMVPGTDEGTPVVGFQPETKTLTVGDEKITITTTDMGINADRTIVIDLKVVNDGKNDITLVKTAASSMNAKEVAVSAYFDGKYANKVLNQNIELGTVTKFVAKESNISAQDAVTTISIKGTAVPEKWDSLSLVFILKANVNGKPETTEVTYVLNK